LGRLAFAADPEVTSYKLELVASRLGVELTMPMMRTADVTATLDILGGLYLPSAPDGRDGNRHAEEEKTRKYFKI